MLELGLRRMSDLRRALGGVLALVLCLSAGGRALAADGEAVTDPVRAMLALPDVPPAGNKTCWFDPAGTTRETCGLDRLRSTGGCS